MNFQEFMSGAPARGRTGAQVPVTPVPTKKVLPALGEIFAQSRWEQGFESIPLSLAQITPGMPTLARPPVTLPAPMFPTVTVQTPTLVKSTGQPIQEVQAPSTVTAPLNTSVTNVPGMDTIRNLLIIMVILQFLGLFGQLGAGFLGGTAAGLVKG